MITQEQLDGWRKLADRLSYYGAESDAADAITSLLDEVARLTAENERLSAIVAQAGAA